MINRDGWGHCNFQGVAKAQILKLEPSQCKCRVIPLLRLMGHLRWDIRKDTKKTYV